MILPPETIHCKCGAQLIKHLTCHENENGDIGEEIGLLYHCKHCDGIIVRKYENPTLEYYHAAQI